MISQRGMALADRHRIAQAGLTRTTLVGMLRLWPLLVAGGDVDANTPRWLEMALGIIGAQRAQSAALAAQFATAFRAVELGPPGEGDFVPVPQLTLNLAQATTSLMVTGPLEYKKAMAGQLRKDVRDLTPRDLLEAPPMNPGLAQKVAAKSARAAQRHVLNGARETFRDVHSSDRQVTGWMRLVDGDPCWFCAMLASRGPVYEDDSFEESNAKFKDDPRRSTPADQKVHDFCGCMLVPMYRQMSDNAGEQHSLKMYKDFDALWRSTGNALDFRRAYEGRTR